MKKKDTVKKAKDRAWKAFAQYIKMRDCLLTTGKKKEFKCITCGKRIPFKKGHASHFIDSRSKEVLFDEKLAHASCMPCNVMLHGNKDSYAPVMILKYGLEFVLAAWQRKIKARSTKQVWTIPELLIIEKEYSDLFKELEENN
jgi:hypothetical protein